MLSASNPHPVVDERDPRAIERAKMTPGLRYDILLRDKFTCKGCGRSPSRGDPVTLHVDHIVAIALGGKTVPENLQTLCQDCNLGKGTKPWMDDPQLSMF
ncbi:MAG: HNH endonuclease signature motif containing protein [Anaerolineae bacterium]